MGIILLANQLAARVLTRIILFRKSSIASRQPSPAGSARTLAISSCYRSSLPLHELSLLLNC